MNVEEVKDFFKNTSFIWEGDKKLAAKTSLTKVDITALKKAIDCGLIEEMLEPVAARTRRPVIFDKISTEQYVEEWIINCNINNSSYKVFKNVAHLSMLHPVISPNKGIITDEVGGLLVFERIQDNATGKLKNYLDLVNVWNILKSCSDDNTSNSLTFLHSRKLVLNNKYNPDVLENGFDGLCQLKKLLNNLDKDKHSLEKKHILQNTLVSMLDNINQEEHFEYIIKNFSKFSIRFVEGYQAYVVGFSFDKLREEHEERYRDSMVSINNLISSVLIKSLMLPAGMFLAATRTMSIVTAKDIQQGAEFVVSNFAVGIAVLAIAFVFFFILSSEKNSLEAIEFEYNSLMGRLKDKSTDAYNAIDGHKKRLDERISFAKQVIAFLRWVTAIFLATAVFWVVIRQF